MLAPSPFIGERPLSRRRFGSQAKSSPSSSCALSLGQARLKKYGRTKNNASTAKTSRSISAFTSRRKYPNRWKQGRRPERREEIGNDPGGTAVRRRAE